MSQEPEATQWREMRDAVSAQNTAKDAVENDGIVEALGVFKGK